MRRSYRLFVLCLILFLSILLAGCKSQDGEPSKTEQATEEQGQSQPTPFYGINIPDPVAQETPGPNETATNPSQTSATIGQLGQILFLPSLFKEGQANANVNPYSAQAVDLPPEKWQEWPVVPKISAHALEIYQAGIAQGNDQTHFSKVGDCQNIRQYFLGLFDQKDTYRLGDNYEYLQGTIDYYAGSWSRLSEAVRTGFNVASVLAPLHADPKTCQAGETPLACEIRVWNPSFVIISMETWTSDRPTQVYEDYLRKIVEYAISKNVLPIVATKADNLEGNQMINQIVANVAHDYDIPMWNFWAATNPLSDHGLMEDHFHLTNGPNYFDDPKSLDLGWPVRNLTALLVVDAVWKTTR